MSKIIAISAFSCLLLAIGSPVPAAAEPDVEPGVADAVPAAAGVAAPPSPGAVPSAEPGVLTTPEGWKLTVAARDEVQVAVNPLTTALSSREYLVAGTFTGSVAGSGTTKLAGGVFEVGYQLGCGIVADKVKLTASAGLNTSGSMLTQITGAGFPISGTIEVALKPGEVKDFPVTKKEFKGTDVRVSVHDIHVKIDGCAGQSFLRSYAVLNSKNDVTDDIVAYYGLTKVV